MAGPGNTRGRSSAPISNYTAPLRLTSVGVFVEDGNRTVGWSTPPSESLMAALHLGNSVNLVLLDE